ncbi:MAG: DUF2489 domain-containing protein [Pseudomonadota bacterium]
MSHLTLALILLGSLALLTLGAYALVLWRRVWARQQAQAITAQAQQQRQGEDLRLLAGSLLDEQLPLIEGAIRIKVLLDHYALELSRHPRCEVFHRLFEATAQVPTHEAWQALDKIERRRHEVHFHELELQHKADARAAARWLLEEGLVRS